MEDKTFSDDVDDPNAVEAIEAESKIIKEGYGVFDRTNFIKTLRENKTFRMNAIGIVFCHAVSSFSFTLFTFMLPNLKGNIYLNGFLIGSFEVMAYSFSGLMMKLLGLRY